MFELIGTNAQGLVQEIVTGRDAGITRARELKCESFEIVRDYDVQVYVEYPRAQWV